MFAVRLVRTMYVLSGAATVTYQVAWAQALTFTFGRTEAALASVVVSVLSGLAIGAGGASTFADRIRPDLALRFFALAQAGAGCFALLFHPISAALVPWVASAYRDGQGGLWFAAVRSMGTAAALLVPTILLGASYPLAIRWLDGRERYPASGAAWLYALHALGGAVGLALTGLLFVPTIGATATTLVAASTNWLIALAALALGYFLSAAAGATASSDTSGAAKRTLLGTVPARSRPWLARVALLGSGFVLLAYQTIWTRILFLILGPSALVDTTVAVVVATGAALGATAATRLLRTLALGQVTVALGIAIASGGVCSLITAWSVPQLPVFIASAHVIDAGGIRAVLANQSVVIAAVMLPMTVALGSTFPFAVAIALPNRTDDARRAAALWALQLLGSLCGLLFAGFILIELFGLRWSLMTVALLAFLIGVWVVLLAGETTVTSRLVWAAVVASATFSAFVLPEWEPKLLSSGASELSTLRGPDLRTALEASQLLFYEEGVAGTASVRRAAGTTSLALDGHVRATNGPDSVPQKLLAHIALLLHPAPRDLCVLGLETGITTGAVLRHPIAQVDVVEPSPEIVQASSYFATENHGALSDPRVNLVIGDGIAHLQLSAKQYDVILSDPPSLWIRGQAPLVSQEFYGAARDRLNAGGVFAQWISVGDLDKYHLDDVLATFASVFAEASVWLIPNSGVILAGSLAPMDPRIDTIVDQWDRPGMEGELQSIGALGPSTVLDLWAGNATTMKRLSQGRQPLSADRPTIGRTPRAAPMTSVDEGLEQLESGALRETLPDPVRAVRDEASPMRLLGRAQLCAHAGARTCAVSAFAEAADLQPTNGDVLAAWLAAAEPAGREGEVAAFLARTTTRDPANVAAAVELSRLQASQGRGELAMATAERAAEQAPDDPRPMVQLATIAAEQGEADRLASLLDELKASEIAESPDVALLSAQLAWLKGDLQATIAALLPVVAAMPDNAEAWALLGRAYARAGNRDRARDAFQSAIDANPRELGYYVELGEVELDNANAEGAVVWFSQALAINAEASPAIEGLARALRRLGQTRRAAELEARLSGASR